MEARDILIRPIITEKTTALMEEGKYTFRVPLAATKVDIRNISEIKLMSKSAKLLTTHPSSSYALVRDANKQYTLRITNPQIFWSTSKYLVVLVK